MRNKRPQKEIYHKIWNDNNPNDPIQKGDGFCIHHIDGNCDNNDPNNLEKININKHNSIHMKGDKNPFYGKHGPMFNKKLSKDHRNKIGLSMKGKLVGENNPSAKLTWSTVNWIRDILNSQEFKEGRKNKLIFEKDICNLFNISRVTLYNIKNNKRWL